MNKKGFFVMMALFVGVMLVLGGGQVFAQTVKMTIQNNTLVGISFAEIKLSSTPAVANATSKGSGPIWATVPNSGVSNGKEKVITFPQAGTYDIRLRTRGEVKWSKFYVQKNVRIADGATINFTSDNEITLGIPEFQEIIQDRCVYNNPKDVFDAVNKLGRGSLTVYEAWAKSYTTGSYGGTRPLEDTEKDKTIIANRCGFSKTDAPTIFSTIEANHRHFDDLIRVWVDSYYIKRAY